MALDRLIRREKAESSSSGEEEELSESSKIGNLE
jgi:hypothetical protein